MEQFNNTLKSRGLKPSSIKTYNSNLTKLIKDVGFDFTGADSIKSNLDKILELIETKKTSVKKNYLAVLLVILSPKKKFPLPQYKKEYELLNTMIIKLNNDYSKTLKDKQLNPADLANVISLEEVRQMRDNQTALILTRYNKKQKLNDSDLRIIQDIFILGLYTYLPPRRLIFASCLKMEDTDYKKLSTYSKDNNVILVHSKAKVPRFIHYGRNATKSKTQEHVVVPIRNPQHKKLCKLWLNVNTTPHLLLQTDMKTKLTENGLSKRFKSIFKLFFKKDIGIVLFRKLFISQTITAELSVEQQELIARQMGHTPATQMGVYHKELPEKKKEQKIKFKIKK